MEKFDLEDLLDSVEQIMKDGGALNAQINAVEAEKIAKNKGLTPALKTIPNNGFYRQTWNNKILQSSPAIFFGVEDVAVVDGGGAAAKTYKVFVEIVYTDNGQSNDSDRRIARYSRALEELFEKNYAPAIAGGRVKIESVRPIAFKLQLDSSEEIKVGGISISITLV